MYKEIGQLSEATVLQLREFLDDAPWQVSVSDVTDHRAFSCMEQVKDVDEIVALWPIDTWDQLIFLRLPPGGKLYRHHDKGFGFHIPVETNKQCESLSYENNIRKVNHLEVGKIYHTDRSIEHESLNNGDTDRTHLIVMLKDTIEELNNE